VGTKIVAIPEKKEKVRLKHHYTQKTPSFSSYYRKNSVIFEMGVMICLSLMGMCRYPFKRI
jgi:hypothetical protein